MTEKKVIMSKEFNNREDYLDYCAEMYSKGFNVVRKAGYKVEIVQPIHKNHLIIKTA